MKKDILEKVGTMQQVAFVRTCTVTEGRANSMRAIQVKNGPMQYMLSPDKCMDIVSLEYNGMNMSFTSKPGLNGRNPYDTHGGEALRSIMGGLFFTCGFENICAPCESDGKEYPMHGRMRTTPAEHVSSDAFWKDGEYLLTVSGEMREAELFGENMILRRTVESAYGSARIDITDKVSNQSAREETMMLMYHCNFGYPFLEEDVRLILPTRKVTPREEWSGLHRDRWNVMDAPSDNAREYVFLHELASGEDGETFAAIVNDKLGIGVRISFNRKNLPYFMEWKSTASGDYVIGLEPSNSSVYGRKYHESQNTLPTLPPYGEETIKWSFTILRDAKEIIETENECAALLESIEEETK